MGYSNHFQQVLMDHAGHSLQVEKSESGGFAVLCLTCNKYLTIFHETANAFGMFTDKQERFVLVLSDLEYLPDAISFVSELGYYIVSISLEPNNLRLIYAIRVHVQRESPVKKYGLSGMNFQ